MLLFVPFLFRRGQTLETTKTCFANMDRLSSEWKNGDASVGSKRSHSIVEEEPNGSDGMSITADVVIICQRSLSRVLFFYQYFCRR